jgi:hypothetical protein
MKATVTGTRTAQTTAPTRKAAGPVLQRACACGKHTADQNGECTECRKKRLGLQRRAVGQGPDVAPPIVHEVLRSPGRPLDDATRGFMESRFNHDFSGVRVHTDARAAESARAVNALAYTVGNHVAFDVGQFAPTTSAGRGLLAHELTHVVQQGGGPSATGHWPTSALSVGPRSSPLEQMAELASRAAEPAADSTVALGSVSGMLQRADRGEVGAAPATCPPSAELDAIERRYRDMVQAARDDGKNVAADNLEHFLNGSGTKRTLSVPWLRGFSTLLAAERANQVRFEDQLNSEANGMSHGDRRTKNDYWDKQFTASVFEELYYASGTSTIRSTGTFSLERIENVVNLGGTVTHHWHDPYDWHAGLSAFIPGFGSVSDADALAIENCRGARSFDMEADWQQSLTGRITVGTIWNDKTFTWSGP